MTAKLEYFFGAHNDNFRSQNSSFSRPTGDLTDSFVKLCEKTISSISELRRCWRLIFGSFVVLSSTSKPAKYEPPTPSQLGDRVPYIFARSGSSHSATNSNLVPCSTSAGFELFWERKLSLYAPKNTLTLPSRNRFG